MSRCDSAAIVPNTSELLPEPEMPVNTVSRRLGISTLTSLRLFTRAPCTRIWSWLSAALMPLTLGTPRPRRFSIPARSALRRLHEPGLVGEDHRLHAIAQAELGEDAADRRVDRGPGV